MAKNSKNKNVIVQDNTNEDEAPKVSKKLADRVAGMTAAEKAEFAAALGLPVKKISEPKPKEPTKTDKFNEACDRLAGQVDSLRTIIEGCDFPNGFAVSIGTDADGKPTFDCKQVRAQYAPRGSKKAKAASA